MNDLNLNAVLKNQSPFAIDATWTPSREIVKTVNGYTLPSVSRDIRIAHADTPFEEPGIEEHKLCNSCHIVLQASKILNTNTPQDSWVLDDEIHSHHLNVIGLLISAAKGCHLCTLLVSWRMHLRNIRENDEITYDLHIKAHQVYGWALITPQSNCDKAWYGEAVYVGNTSRQSNPQRRREALQSWRTDSNPCLELVRGWLRRCLEAHHGACSSRDSSGFLPRRLLQLSIQADQISIRLVHSRDIPSRQPYICLSHCWGTHPPLKLLKSNLANFLNSVSLSSLPRTFIDAVLVTLRLGYEYLWIDSLCVIQDSKVDFQEQIPEFGRIYSCCEFTIAALGAVDGTVGCFSSRNLLEYNSCVVSNTNGQKLHLSPGNTTWSAGPDEMHGSQASPLHRRAWVVQERTLSPRTVYFGSNMIFWECIEGRASEMYPDMEESWAKNFLVHESKDLAGHEWILMNPKDQMKCSFAVLLRTCADVGYRLWGRTWWNIVRIYTACQLTFDRDKWNAISGLATQVESTTGEPLVHGLWSTHLVQELLWHTFTGGRKVEIDVPSWSWLSVSAEVMGHTLSPNAVVSVSVQLLDKDESSEGGMLEARSPLMLRGLMTKLKSKHKFNNSYTATNSIFTKALWTADTPLDEKQETWAIQFYHHQDIKYRYFGGLIVGPKDDYGGSNNNDENMNWVRLGAYHITMDLYPRELRSLSEEEKCDNEKVWPWKEGNERQIRLV